MCFRQTVQAPLWKRTQLCDQQQHQVLREERPIFEPGQHLPVSQALRKALGRAGQKQSEEKVHSESPSTRGDGVPWEGSQGTDCPTEERGEGGIRNATFPSRIRQRSQEIDRVG